MRVEVEVDVDEFVSELSNDRDKYELICAISYWEKSDVEDLLSFVGKAATANRIEKLAYMLLDGINDRPDGFHQKAVDEAYKKEDENEHP